MTRSILAALLAGFVGLSAGAAAVGSLVTPGERTLRVSGVIQALSADGQRVAMIVGRSPTACAHVEVWAPGDGNVLRVPPSGPGCTRIGESLDEIALAGARVAWLYADGFNAREQVVVAAGLERPDPTLVSEIAYNQAGGNPAGDYLGGLHGDGPLLVYDHWSRCDPYLGGQPGGCRPGRPAISGAVLRRVGGGIVRRGPSAMLVTSVDAGRIAVTQLDGRVTVLRPNGTALRQLGFGRSRAQSAKLSGPDLVVLLPARLDEYDLGSGRLRRSCRLAAAEGGRRLTDVHAGLAVIVERAQVRVWRLRDCGHVVVALPRDVGPVDAQLVARGVFYSYNERTGTTPGRVTFLPWEALARRFPQR